MSCNCGGCNSTVQIPSGAIGPQGPQGPAATVIVPNTVFVSTSGNDSTGTAQRLDKPFITIGAAISAAVALSPSSTKRVSVIIFGGTFTENITIANSYITLASFYGSPLMYDDSGYTTIASRFTTTKRPVHISGTITVTADFVTISGINCTTIAQNTVGTNCQFSHIIASTSITTNSTTPSGSYFDVHSNIFLSLPSTGTLSGYYEKCTGGDTSFGGNSSANAGNISGTLIDCVSTNYAFASANANNAGNISGTLKRCKSTGIVSFSSSGSGTGGTISGHLEDCISIEGATTAFGSSTSAAGGVLSGVFIRCMVEHPKSFGYGGTTAGSLTGSFFDCVSLSSDAFGCFVTTGNLLSGNFYNCIADDIRSFGSTTTGSGATLSGKFSNCIGNEAAFGCSTTGTAAVLSGTFENCRCIDFDNVTYCFASSVGGTAGSITGKLIDCIGIGESFCSSNTTGGTVTSTGRLINCTASGNIMLRKAVVSGVIRGAIINQTNLNEPAIIIAGSSTASISYCTLKGNGSANSIHAASAISASIWHTNTCGAGLHTNVTNLIETPFNVDDASTVF